MHRTSSPNGRHRLRLIDRRAERDVLEALPASLWGGRSEALVLRGEAGIGKSALLACLEACASGCRIARAVGVESEMGLAFAGLHQLCAPFLERMEQLPVPQRDALSAALGLSVAEPPDRFMVGLAVLGLLADVAEEAPLVCLLDDAHWLDRISIQTLAFVARRLLAERIALVFATRDHREDELEGLPELEVRGLSHADARLLLDSVITGPVDEQVRDRIVAETRGNPLALLELPRGLTPAELAFGFGLPETMPTVSRIEAGFLRRLEPLPLATRRLLLVAAVEPTGDIRLLWRAGTLLGIGPGSAVAAGAAGLLELGGRVRFRHPLVRSAIYRAADPHDLREVHHALAEVVDPDLDPDRRAWHRAHAANGPDEAVARELESSADRAQMRGGRSAAAALLERAARLTRDPALRARRALAAAQATHEAGAPDAALALLAIAEAEPSDALERARIELLRAQISFTSRRGVDAPALLLEAARKLEPLDMRLARETHLEALTAALIVGRLATGTGAVEVAQAARRLPASSTSSRAPDLLLDGLALLITDGRAVATPLLRRALGAFRDLPMEERLRWLWLAGWVSQDLWDDESWKLLSESHVRLAKQAGALSRLPLALRSLTAVHAWQGELEAGAALAIQMQSVNEATGIQLAPYGAIALAAWRGDETEARELIAATVAEVTERGEGVGLGFSHFAGALLYNGLCRYREALEEARAACEHDDFGVSARALPELIEAATRNDQPDLAAAAFERLSATTAVAGTDWALGIEARSHALVSADEAAEPLYREAVARLECTRLQTELARARLLYGEWLRRAGRRVDARMQLRPAHEMFSRIGAQGFAQRARRELTATGETVRKRSVETRDELTAHEAEIARLAAEGGTNPEIGAELFISPRTVEWHLRKVFAKLDIASRKELPVALGGGRGQRPNALQLAGESTRHLSVPRAAGIARGLTSSRHGREPDVESRVSPRHLSGGKR